MTNIEHVQLNLKLQKTVGLHVQHISTMPQMRPEDLLRARMKKNNVLKCLKIMISISVLSFLITVYYTINNHLTAYPNDPVGKIDRDNFFNFRRHFNDDKSELNEEIVLNLNTNIFPAKLIQNKVDRLLQLHINNTYNHETDGCWRPAVPSTVHWTWLYRDPGYRMRFHQCISALSVIRFLQPDRIMMWYEHKPKGAYWDYFLEELNKTKTFLDMIHMDIPDSIYEIPVNVPEHVSDIVRISKLIEYGGIYLDLDVVVLKSFAPLMCYDVVLGKERWDGLCGGIILAKPNATFMNIWKETYRTLDDEVWDEHAVRMPMVISHLYPYLLHVEKDTMHRPNWMELSLIYQIGTRYDWSNNFALHTWYRKYDYEHNPEDIRGLDSTLGQIFRYVLYGSPDLLPTKINYDDLELPLQKNGDYEPYEE